MGERKDFGKLSFRILLGCFLIFPASAPLLCAQGQQPAVLIDFDQLTAPVDLWFGLPGQTLTVGSATFSSELGGLLRNQALWSVDHTNVFMAEWALPQLRNQQPNALQPSGPRYVRQSHTSPQSSTRHQSATLHQSTEDCSPDGSTVVIDFNQTVSNFSALLLNNNVNGQRPVTFTVCDDQGGNQQFTAPTNGSVIVSLPDNGISQVVITPGIPSADGVWAIDNVQFTPMSPVLLDPVDSGFLNGGSQVCGTCTAQMASGGMPITGVAADGVTEAVVRIPANYAGESLTVKVLDENGGQETVQNEGGLFQLGGSPQSAQSTLTNVTAVNTPKGPMAFVIYLSPMNYARNSDDYNWSSRLFSLQIKS